MTSNSPGARIRQTLEKWRSGQSPEFQSTAYTGDAKIRLFFALLNSIERIAAQREVDLIYQQILNTRRTEPFTLDDYLILMRVDGAEAELLDEELERDPRVCRTLVWGSANETVADFLARTPFADLSGLGAENSAPSTESIAALDALLVAYPPDLQTWLKLATRADFENLSVQDWITEIGSLT